MDENKIKKYPPNICLAPFAYLTFDPNKNVSPCPALGGSVWKFPEQTMKQIWENENVVEFRNKMLNNERHDVCARCWEEEEIGFTSQRTRLWDMCADPDGTATNILESGRTPQDVLEPATYLKGPMQLAIKISNVCNLRCRSCNSRDSITLAVEGEYYAETYGLTGEENMYIMEKESKTFADDQIDDIVSICSNVRRIEFYGGEPLLDKQLPRLLQKLIDVGYSKEITINISTNCTHELSPALVKILNEFKAVNFNLSIDGWAEQFTYIRHPGDWDVVYKNILKFIRVAITSKVQIKLLPVITVTSMNVYYLPELVKNLKEKFRLTPFMIIARLPDHFSIRHVPEPIAQEVVTKLQAYTDYDFSSIVKLLDAPADPAFWTSFKKWIRIIDEYRKEDFTATFPEYTKLIRKHDAEFLL